MSEQPLPNGPTTDINSSKNEVREMPKSQQNGQGSPPIQPPGPPINTQRPLYRIDSKSNFLYRPPFPNQPQQQFVPPRTPIQRPPGSQQIPQGQTFATNQPRPNFRPNFSPFPRRPPGIFQQRSVPGFGNVRPFVPEGGIVRSQTLDPTEIDRSKNDDNKINNPPRDFVKPPSIAAMNNRSYSLSSNPPETTAESKEETRRKSVSSVESYGEGRPSSRQSSDSNENLEEGPSRPESRSTSRMNKIVEDEDKSQSSLTEVSQKSVDISPKSPINKTEESTTPSQEFIRENINQASPSVKQEKRLDLEEAKSTTKEGDNDSGVDESTQGNDQAANGDGRSARKSSKSRTSTSTPVARSSSRGSKSPSLKSPDSNATTPGSTSEKKKLPMNKIQVGNAPSPNLKVVKSKIGSLENANYKPGGGNVKIENKKIEFKVAPRIEAKNEKYTPRSGEKKIVHQKLQWNAKSKIGSLENATHKPKGGDKKIESIKLDFKEKAKPKVGSKDNIKHQPGGGDIKIENRKIEIKAGSKIGSLDNVKYKPGGGDKKIFDDKDYLRQMSGVSSMEHSLSTSQNSIPSQPDKAPVADENLNQEH
ncbi:microtubule-associated protein tau isoform X1 [Diorhabda sublineata]|uniref:microtubule-associated protein tau isoform X1 n=1 Tax=Diorhabda sublineata TaxID=1163346 RepID=UPI0024E0EA57|nr:microtubule-associated protein tau isoform X1 [Diorhabda sublineata]XP_056640735.1 microtubule-associated protein tau isoform X1 [Diorhabda sublineata]